MSTATWETKRLEEVATISTGNSAPQAKRFFAEGTIPFFRTSDVGRVHISNNLTNSKDKVTREAIETLKLRIYPQGTILFPKSGASVFLNHRVMLGVSGAVSSHLATITANQSLVIPDFLFYLLCLIDAKTLTANQDYPSLRTSDLACLKIQLPSISVQRQIVDRLNMLWEAQDINEQMILKADELLKSRADEWFGNVSQDTVRNLGEVLDAMEYGISVGMNNAGRGIKILRMNNIINAELDGTDIKFAEISPAEKEKYLLKKGDVLINRVNSYELVGKTGIFNLDDDYVFASYLIRLRPKENELDKEYLNYFLNSMAGGLQIRKRAKRAVSQANINTKDIASFQIPVPSLKKQQGCVARLNAISSYRKLLIRRKDKLNELLVSVLSKAFTGELVREEATQTVKINKFALQQAIAAILKQFERGEMVIAKVLYIAQEVYKVPLGFRFSAQNFGPYDAEIKRILMSGMSTYNRFFTRKGIGVYALGANSGKLFKYRSKALGNMTIVLNDLLPYIKNADSSSIECLATVCKIMQDNQTTDLDVVKQKMHEWKKDKFSQQLIKGTYDFAISKGWDKKLIR